MATSNSTPHPDSPGDGAPAIEPRQQMLETVGEQVAALDLLIGLARRSVRVFDVDLSQTGWNTAKRTEGIASFLRRNADARLEIIVHDTHYLEASCARMAALIKTWSHAITIYRTGAEARGAMDPLTIVDQRHYLHRFHIDHPRASLAIEQPLAARPLVNRLDEIWASGEPGLGATVLGL
jgi:hypothetical protein